MVFTVYLKDRKLSEKDALKLWDDIAKEMEKIIKHSVWIKGKVLKNHYCT